MPSPNFIPVPLDVKNPLALRRFLTSVVEQLDKIDKVLQASAAANTANIAANASDTATNTANIAANASSIATLNANLNQAAITDLALAAIVASATYSQVESQQLAGDIQTLQTSINSILNSLRKSKIIV